MPRKSMNMTDSIQSRKKKHRDKVSARIREARTKAKTSTEHVAEIIGVDRSSIERWETIVAMETSEPTASQIKLYCDRFQCDVGYLFGDYDCETREISDIHEITGLSESAASAIIKICRESPAHKEALDFLLTNKGIEELIGALYLSLLSQFCVMDEKPLPESFTVLTGISEDNLSQVHISKVRGLAEKILREYHIQPNDLTKMQIKATRETVGFLFEVERSFNNREET